MNSEILARINVFTAAEAEVKRLQQQHLQIKRELESALNHLEISERALADALLTGKAVIAGTQVFAREENRVVYYNL